MHFYFSWELDIENSREKENHIETLKLLLGLHCVHCVHACVYVWTEYELIERLSRASIVLCQQSVLTVTPRSLLGSSSFIIGSFLAVNIIPSRVDDSAIALRCHLNGSLV